MRKFRLSTSLWSCGSDLAPRWTYIVLGVSASQREQELQDQLQMLRKELKEMQRRILVMLEILGESA